MVELMNIDLDKNLIFFKDIYGILKKHKPKLLMGSRTSNIQYALPLNYWTISLFLQHIGWEKGVNWKKDIFDKLEGEYKYLEHWKINCLENKEKVEELASTIKISPKIDKILYPYQKIDAKLMAEHKSFANLNCMRSGKTFTTCAAMEIKRLETPQQKVLISIIQATNQQWKNSINEIAPNYRIIDLTEIKNKKIRAAQYKEFVETQEAIVLIVNRDKLKADIQFSNSQKNYLVSMDVFKKLKYGFITDEVHFTRNPSSLQSQCHFFLSHWADFSWGLTGTKISNLAEDLYGLLKYLQPHIYKSVVDFRNRYLIEDKIRFGSVSFSEYKRMNEDTKAELCGLIYMLSVERTEAEVLSWVPQMQELEPVLLKMEPQQEKIYDTLFNEMEIEIEKENAENEFISIANHLALRTKLLQVASSVNMIDESIEELSNKEQWIVNYLKDNADYNIKPVIFGRFSKSVLIPFAKKLEKIQVPNTKRTYRVGLITGSTISKSAVQENWQNGEYDILICNIKSGGVGLTLDYGDVAIFMERDDDLASNEQAKKRIMNTKKDDKRIKQIINLVTTHPWSVDLVQYASQQQKQGWVMQMYPNEMTKNLLEWEAKTFKKIKGDT